MSDERGNPVRISVMVEVGGVATDLTITLTTGDFERALAYVTSRLEAKVVEESEPEPETNETETIDFAPTSESLAKQTNMPFYVDYQGIYLNKWAVVRTSSGEVVASYRTADEARSYCMNLNAFHLRPKQDAAERTR